MGTRADFYVGKGETAEWLGSIAWDGYRPGVNLKATTEAEWRESVKACLSKRDDASMPDDGWPWPWKDSQTTDFAYCFTGASVEVFCFGRPFVEEEDGEDAPVRPKAPFPDMTKGAKVALGKRSGLIVLRPDADGKMKVVSDD